jgi:hypothetical protein
MNDPEATLSTLNLSSNNFSEELANLASLTNSSDNIIENPHISTSNPQPVSIQCDNQYNHQSNNEVAMDLSMTAPSSVDSAVGTECNGLNPELYAKNNQIEDPTTFVNCNSLVPNEPHQSSASSASSTSSGNFSTSPSQQNVFVETTAFSSSYLCTLLEKLENEIAVTQQHLDDENDKRHKYKVNF